MSENSPYLLPHLQVVDRRRDRGRRGPRTQARQAHECCRVLAAGVLPAGSLAPRESWLTAAIPMDNPYCSCKRLPPLPPMSTESRRLRVTTESAAQQRASIVGARACECVCVRVWVQCVVIAVNAANWTVIVIQRDGPNNLRFGCSVSARLAPSAARRMSNRRR